MRRQIAFAFIVMASTTAFAGVGYGQTAESDASSLTIYQTCNAVAAANKPWHREVEWEQLGDAFHFDVRFAIDDARNKTTIYVRGCGTNKNFHRTIELNTAPYDLDFYALPLVDDKEPDFVLQIIPSDTEPRSYIVYPKRNNYAEYLKTEWWGNIDYFVAWDDASYRLLLNRIISFQCSQKGTIPAISLPPTHPFSVWKGEDEKPQLIDIGTVCGDLRKH